jgi:hypothetical protein
MGPLDEVQLFEMVKKIIFILNDDFCKTKLEDDQKLTGLCI